MEGTQIGRGEISSRRVCFLSSVSGTRRSSSDKVKVLLSGMLDNHPIFVVIKAKFSSAEKGNLVRVWDGRAVHIFKMAMKRFLPSSSGYTESSSLRGRGRVDRGSNFGTSDPLLWCLSSLRLRPLQEDINFQYL